MFDGFSPFDQDDIRPHRIVLRDFRESGRDDDRLRRSRRHGSAGWHGVPVVVRRITSAPDQVCHREPATVVTQDGNTLIIPRKGLELPRHLSFERWVGIGLQLSSLTTSMAWCLGDWLVYGESAFTGRYREAIERTSLDYQTLRNYSWVARRFALSRRRDSVSFGHHAELAALAEPEQDYWLRRAEELSWSRNRLRAEVRASLRERDVTSSCERQPSADATADSDRDTAHAAATDSHPASAVCPELTLKVRISSVQMERCRAAAVTYGVSLEEWVRQALEEVARGVLGLASSVAPAGRTSGSHLPQQSIISRNPSVTAMIRPESFFARRSPSRASTG